MFLMTVLRLQSISSYVHLNMTHPVFLASPAIYSWTICIWHRHVLSGNTAGFREWRTISLFSHLCSLFFHSYNVLLFVMLYCLPVTFNLTIGFLTGRRLWGGKKSAFSDLDPRSQALHASRLKTRQKIAKMVVCLVLLFAVSWLPLYLADLWIDCEQRPPSWLLQTRPFAQWLGLTNSSLNPICYCFIGDLYRSAKVIRTRYYQKVAALFGSSSFSSSVAVASPAVVITDTKVTAAERHHIAAATAASATIATIPRLLSLAGGQGLVQKVRDSSDTQAGSDHSISDWCRSSPSMCNSSLFPSQLHALQHSIQKTGFLPTRRHSENIRSLPLRIDSVEIDMLPLRRHSGERIYGLSADKRDATMQGDALCYTGQQRRKTSQVYSLVGDSEDERTELTSLWKLQIISCFRREVFFSFCPAGSKNTDSSQFTVWSWQSGLIPF